MTNFTVLSSSENRELEVILRVKDKNTSLKNFQPCINKTCQLNQDNFIAKDTKETASHFMCKNC